MTGVKYREGQTGVGWREHDDRGVVGGTPGGNSVKEGYRGNLGKASTGRG